MPKYLIADSTNGFAILEKDWPSPKRINQYWFGQHAENCYMIPQVYEDTKENREFLQEWLDLQLEAKRIKEKADKMLYTNKCVKP